ncbi:MAG: zinc-binding dehydrogenase [Nitrospiraceae bacterium]
MDHRKRVGHRRGHHPDDLTEIAQLVDSGKLRSIVEIVLALSEARRAHELSQTGHRRGKIVLRVV